MGCRWGCVEFLPLLICLTKLWTPVAGAEQLTEVAERSGRSIWLSCKAQMDDELEVTWLRSDFDGSNNITIVQWANALPEPNWNNNFDHDRLEFDTKNLSLNIRRTSFSDRGQYICQLVPINSTDINYFYEEKTNVVIFDPPGPPLDPKLIIHNATAAEARWKTNEYNGNSVVSGFIIYQRSIDGENTEKVNITVPAEAESWPLLNLHPYTFYEFDMVAKNRAGLSVKSDLSDPNRTDEAVPSAEPRINSIQNFTNHLVVEFGPCPPSKLNGELKGYELKWSPEDDTKSEETIETFLANASQTSYTITGLEADSLYAIELAMFNNAGKSPVVQRLTKTDEGVPGPPRIISITNQTNTSLQVVWEKPVKPNGKLLLYYLKYTYTTQAGTSSSKRHIPIRGTSSKGLHTYVVQNLIPYTSYEIEVYGTTSKGDGEPSEIMGGLTDVTGPSAPAIVNITLNDTNSIILEWTSPEMVVKQIDKYCIRYRAQGMQWTMKNITVTVDDAFYSCEINSLDSGSTYEFQVAGATHSLFQTLYDFYIGPYSLLQTFETPAAIQIATTLKPEQRASFSVGIIVGLVCTALLLLTAVMVFLVMRRILKARYRFIADPETTKLTSNTVALPDCYAVQPRKLIIHTTLAPETPAGLSSSDESDYVSISVDLFGEHVASHHVDGDLLFSQEYDEINQATKDLSTTQSSDPVNKSKNRYTNILAYDHSRVMLRPLQGIPKSDYINANFVDGYHKPQAYIAAQGPLPSTFSDFWRMVWEQQSSVIIMITNLWEKGRRKCDQYWPSDTEQQYGAISVHLESTDIFAHYTVRIFTIRNTKTKKRGDRTVYQYHYTDWPDHGVPDYTLPVLAFVRKSLAVNPPGAGPPVVHCSAGVGRTGTYIVVDSMIRQIHDKSTISSYGFLSHIRNQRNYLVQTEEQYIFIHDVLLEYIQSGETEVRDSALAAYVEELEAEPAASGISGMEKQYKLATSHSPEDDDLHAAMLPANIEKNRSKQILPVDPTRVRLPMKAGVEGSDYINASFFQGFYKNEEYVVTQHPHRTTIEDFWHMVWDQNSMTIVLLSPADKEEYSQFWPDKDETMECGHFKVTFSEESHQLNMVTRDFLLQSTQDDYECTARMISTSYWPDSCSPLHTVFELIQTVRSWHQQHEEVEGPIIAIDRFGGVEASTFCALYSLHEQIQREGTVDVYLVAKLYHLKRPGVFAKKEDYAFLYKALMSICKDKRDSGIGNCSNFPSTLPHAVSRSTSRHSASNPDSRTTTTTM